MTQQEGWKYSPQEYGEMKRREMQELYKQMDETTKAVLGDDETFAAFLRLQSEIDTMSVGNLLLIFGRNPNAREVRTFEGWSKDEIQINKGEKGISVLQPYTFQKDGEAKRTYRVKKVFDVSQTAAQKTSHERNEVTKSEMLDRLMAHAGAEIQACDESRFSDDTVRFSREEGKIYVQKGLGVNEFLNGLVKEIAHAKLYAGGQGTTREENEFAAECITYMLCGQMGLESMQEKIHVPEGLKELEAKDARKEIARTGMIFHQMKQKVMTTEKRKESDRGAR